MGVLEVVGREEIDKIAFVWENSKGCHVLEEIRGPLIVRKFCIQNHYLLSSLYEELGDRFTALLAQNRTC
jgi:hypothetical protein